VRAHGHLSAHGRQKMAGKFFAGQMASRRNTVTYNGISTNKLANKSEYYSKKS